MKLVRSDHPAVAISDLHKSYGDLPVLTGIDLDIHPGEVTAVIGPNGAGKTTLIKCVLGLISADSGQIHVGGSDVSEGIDYRRLIGYVPQKASFPENLTGREVVRLIEKIRGERGQNGPSMIRLLDLEKDPASGEAIDLVFRMAHSIKGMASSLGYDAVTEVAHRLEDRMAVYRQAGRVEGGEGISVLFRGLEGLERMVDVVRETGEPPGPDPELAALLAPGEAEPPPAVDAAPGTDAEVASQGSGLKKKA